MSALVKRTIKNEDDAWAALRDFAASSAALNSTQLHFENFPNIILKYNGSNFHSAIPVRVMEAMRVVQSEIFRIYALVVYEDEFYTLSQEEKDSLELFFRISEGCSELFPKNLTDILNKIVEKAAAKMEGRHYVIATLVVATTYGTITINEAIQNAETERAKIAAQAQVDVAREQADINRDNAETERLRLIAQIIENNIPAKKAAESTERVNESIAKSVKREESVTMSDSTVITEKVAKELYPRSKRRSAQEIRMDGIYTIDRVDKKGDDLRIEFSTSDGARKFVASANDLPQDQQEMLFRSTNGTATLEINAKDLEGEIKDVVILKVVVPVIATSSQ